MSNAITSRRGGAGCPPRQAATNFSGAAATPPSRLMEPMAGSDGRRLREGGSSGAARVCMERAGCRTLVRRTGGCGLPRRAPRSAWHRLHLHLFICL